MSYIQNVRSLRLKRSRVLVVRTRRLLEDDLWTRRLISAAVANEILPSQLDIWRYPEMVHLLSRSESEDGADVYIRAAMLRLDSRTPPPTGVSHRRIAFPICFNDISPRIYPPPPKKKQRHATFRLCCNLQWSVPFAQRIRRPSTSPVLAVDVVLRVPASLL